ncbi:hypothetical protein MKX03_000269 [Papaver bracteatum]|nr:hypothetical protein MKX03_000269 [Papaver bracteatum]
MIKSHSSSFHQYLTFFLIFCSSSVIGTSVAAVVPPSKTFSYELDVLSFHRGFDGTEYDVTKLVFSRSGNLALIDANGRIGWQTKTSNKGVVDIKLLPNGNLVLLDRNGGFVWQSFHYPTNTLLVGQGLGPGSSTTNKIVNGDYSMILQDRTLGLFFNPNPKSASASSKPFNYYKVTQMAKLGINITFDTSKYFYGDGSFDVLSIVMSTDSFFELAYPKYNSTLSMLRLGSNGNLYIYTYNEVPANGFNAWEETYATFSREGRTNECLLPAKCGSFGLCDDNQCVACPTPKGLMGWDKKCKLPKLPSCNTSASNVGYYRVRDVEDYRPLGYSDGEGPMTVNECMKKCSDDCKCVGFFYRINGSMCSLASRINTLAKLDVVLNNLIDAYINYDLDARSFYRGSSEIEYSVRYHPLPIRNDPFYLSFYEANHESTGIHKTVTSNSYILAIGMGMGRRFHHPDGITRWVWAANLNLPVGDKAKLVFSRSGNLALIDANGRIGWQTKTSNKGVIDIKLLPNGNLVLLDKNGGFVWQSFYYPTNTLLVGQGLGLGSSSTNKIVNGDYSMVLQGETLGFFFNPNPKSASATVKPFNYYNVTQMGKLVINITFDTSKFFFGEGSFNVLGIAISADSSFMLAFPKYNSTLSMLRLGSNGNLHIYTYYELSAHGFIAWEETYAAFSREGRPSECLLPEKCGSFGLCKDNQCVACPTPKGLMGWDEKCKLPKVPSCNVSAAKLGYFKVKDVEDYRPLVNSYRKGPISVNECMKKCTDDCQCVGFFYKNNGFKCFLAAQFNTLAKLDAVSKDSIDAYIKYAK